MLRNTLRNTLALAGLVAGALAISKPATAQQFTEKNWTGFLTSSGENAFQWYLTTAVLNEGGTVSAAALSSGGHPGPCADIQLTVNTHTSGNGDATIYALFINNQASYNPAGPQGPITAITYSEDAKAKLRSQGSGLVVAQGDINGVLQYYVMWPFFQVTATKWTHSTRAVSASDLWEILPDGTLSSTSNPDFTTSGSPMQFGFYRLNGAPGGGYSTDVEIDNWSVVLNH